MSFEKLLEELDSLQTLAKSAPADDADDAGIAEAATDAEDDDDDGEGEGHAEPDGDEGMGGEGDGDGDEGMAKSFSLKLDDGQEIEAIDGTELVKSLIERFDSQEETLAKAMGGILELLKSSTETVREQGALIKSLQSDVKRLGGEGRGRKTVVSVAEKPAAGETLAKSEPEGMNANEFMAKALSAQQSGKLTGLEVSIAETSLNKGLPVPQNIVRRVLG